jgi:glycosyltransferase involved in cell wall biosynthesis
MPTIGKCEHISAAIESILLQDYKNLQLIIVNDAKDELSNSRVKGLITIFADRRITVIKSDTLGLSGARNTGIKFSRGDVIFFCDDDDVWHANKIRCQIEQMRYTNSDIHLSNFIKISDCGEVLYDVQKNCSVQFPESLSLDFVAPPSGWAVKARVFERFGGFDEQFLATEDKDFLLRVSKLFTIVRSGPPLLNYRIANDSISRNPTKKLRYNLKLMNRFKKEIRENGKLSYGFVRFLLKVSVACERKYASRVILHTYLNSNASFMFKFRLIKSLFLFSLFLKRVKKDVS